jgi:hypothetical protein
MPPLPLRRTIQAAVVLCWTVMMALLVYRHYGPAPKSAAVSPASLPGGLFGEQWMGIYFNERKVGYTSRTFEKSGGGYSLAQKMTMKLGIMGRQKDVELDTRARLGPDLALSSFILSLRADADITVYGTVEGRNLHVTLQTAGTGSEEDIVLKNKPVLDPAIVPDMFREGLIVGKKYTLSVFDPSTLGRQEMTLEVVGKEKIPVMNKEVEAIRIKGSAGSNTLSLWITDKGEILKEESPMGFVLVAESREEAIRGLSPSADITGHSAVPFNMRLPDNTRYLSVRLSGINLKDFDIDGGRQSLRGNTVQIRREDIEEVAGEPRHKGEAQSEYLRDTMFIQSKDPAIVATARRIVKGETDSLKAAGLICSWVYRNLRKEPSITVPVATEVLRSMRGDCNEHTVLYVALARAAGIPSRIALGLVYANGFFYYHAWPEIYAEGWIAVDPTFGQFPADAAHIRLITGDFDKQARIAEAIGKIKIEGIEYR